MADGEAKALAAPADADVHTRIGQLTRQLHTALTELGFANQLRSTMGELPMRKAACPTSRA